MNGRLRMTQSGIACWDEGSGPPILFIHGHPFDHTMWRPQIDFVVRLGRRAVAPDLRGYGASSVGGETVTLTTFASDLAGALDELAIESAVVCGLSMGGQIAMEFCRLFQRRVSALILADTFAQAETEAGKQARYDMADRLQREGMTQYAKEVLPKMMTPANIGRLPDVASHVLEMMTGTNPFAAAAALRGRAERMDYTAVLKKVRVPTLVVVGAEDAFTPVADAEDIAACVPNARLSVIEAAGHLPNLEQAQAFNKLLENFLAERPVSASSE